MGIFECTVTVTYDYKVNGANFSDRTADYDFKSNAGCPCGYSGYGPEERASIFDHIARGLNTGGVTGAALSPGGLY